MISRKIIENVYFVPGLTNIGIINAPAEDKNNIILIDSGINQKAIKIVIDELDEMFKNYNLMTVINTHGHADHIGGNNFLQKNYDTKVFIPQKEIGNSANRYSSVNLIWGASAIPELKHYYSLEETFTPNEFISVEDEISLSPTTNISFIDLQGHSPEQLGIFYKDDDDKTVLFTADSYLGIDELKKIKISYQEATLTALNTMKKLKKFDADFFVQSHGIVPQTREDFLKTLDANIASIENLIDFLKSKLAKEKLTTEILVAETLSKFEITSKPISFALIYATVKSLLSELYEYDEIGMEISNNRLFWCKD